MDNQTVIRLLLIVLAAIILFGLVGYYNKNKARLESEKFKSESQKKAAMKTIEDYEQEDGEDESREGFAANEEDEEEEEGDDDEKGREHFSESGPERSVMSNDNVPSSLGGSAANIMPAEPESNEQYLHVDFGGDSKPPGARGTGNSVSSASQRVENLLPKDAANTKWAQVNPAGQGDVKDQNLLTAGHHIGINTVGQSNRNPNYQIRSEPPNPRIQVSPWMQSTMDPDLSRRPLEIGSY